MIDVLYNKLAPTNDASLVEWKDVNESIFNKHAQYSQHSHYNTANAANAANAVNTAIVVNVNIEEPPPVVLINPDKEVKLQQVSLQTPKSKKKDKDTTIKPLDIIISETSSFNNSTAYVKDAIVALISKEEFAKIFGATKCAEMMSGVVNNRWNKSTALFISFLLDKEICYNDKVILYNKEKNKGKITIAKNV